jgi:hypothetical protein
LAVAMNLASPAKADIFYTYGAATVIPNPGIPGEGNVLQITSDVAATGYGGIVYDASGNPFAVNQLTTLSALYQMTEGTFGGGAPRFSLFDTTNNTNNGAYIYWGTPIGGGSFSDPNAGSFTSTGNLADLSSSDVRVYVNGFGGQNTPNTGETWSQFVNDQGNTQIAYVTLDLDGGFTGTQQMITDEFTVNDAVYEAGPDPQPTPEPASVVLLGLCGLSLLGFRSVRSVIGR